jgi:hypothetical protein
MSSPPPKQARKTRSDKGSGQFLKQVARARENGLRQGEIGAKYGLSVTTVKRYYGQIRERAGIDAVLRPKKRQPKVVLFTHPLAEALSQRCREIEYEITIKGANGVVAKVLAYAQDLGFQDAIDVMMVERALHRPESRKTRDLTEAWKLFIANRVCEQNPLMRELAVRLRDRGLPSTRFSANGTRQRNTMKLPQAVLHASKALRMPCSGLVPESFYPDVDVIWPYVEEYGGLYTAIEQMKRELADKWAKQQSRGDLEGLAALASTQSSFEYVSA